MLQFNWQKNCNYLVLLRNSTLSSTCSLDGGGTVRTEELECPEFYRMCAHQTFQKIDTSDLRRAILSVPL